MNKRRFAGMTALVLVISVALVASMAGAYQLLVPARKPIKPIHYVNRDIEWDGDLATQVDDNDIVLVTFYVNVKCEHCITALKQAQAAYEKVERVFNHQVVFVAFEVGENSDKDIQKVIDDLGITFSVIAGVMPDERMKTMPTPMICFRYRVWAQWLRPGLQYYFEEERTSGGCVLGYIDTNTMLGIIGEAYMASVITEKQIEQSYEEQP